MHPPTVSFIVPCYKLAHLLPECINSILAQTYTDLEVLIMDDCSPDNTPAIARSFADQRVKHIRNDPNLGHLQNYNKGIGMARGRYVWLISADDYLRRPYVLDRYVKLLDNNPRVGYVFCPGIGVKSGGETGCLDYSVCGNQDWVMAGREFLKQKLLEYNAVVAASGLARRECYEKISLFPVTPEMGWMGDWFIWAVFALYHDVGYFSEPMVCYREHDQSMTRILSEQDMASMVAGDIGLLWLIKQRADAAGLSDVSQKCLEMVAFDFARHLTGHLYRPPFVSTITTEQFEELLCRSTTDERERREVRVQAFTQAGDRLSDKGDADSARRFYRLALQIDPWRAKTQTKRFLLSLGKTGSYLRKGVQAFR